MRLYGRRGRIEDDLSGGKDGLFHEMGPFMGCRDELTYTTSYLLKKGTVVRTRKNATRLSGNPTGHPALRRMQVG